MVWCLMLSFCFLSSAVVSGAPEIRNELGEKNNIKSGRNQHMRENDNVYQIPKLIDRDILNMHTDQTLHCYTPISVKRVIIDILEGVKESPYDIDFIISMLKSEITQESLLPESKENFKSGIPHFNGPLECLRAIKQLAEIAYNAFKELKKLPSCLKYIPLQHKAVDRPEFDAGGTDSDFRNLLGLILQEMSRYAKLSSNEVIPDKIQVSPKTNWPQGHNLKESVSKGLLPRDTVINKPKSKEEAYETNIQPITPFQPESQLIGKTPHVPWEISQSIPEATASLITQTLPLQMILPQEEQAITMQNIDALKLFGPKFKENSILHDRNPHKSNESYKTIFPNHEIIESVYPKFMALTQEPISSETGTEFLNQYIKPNLNSDGKTLVDNQHSVYGDDNSQSVFVNPISFYPNIKQPLYNMESTSISPESNIINLKQPINHPIENIVTLHKQNQAAFNPRLYDMLFVLINTYKNRLIDYEKLNDILHFLLQPEIHNENVEFLWHLLQPDEKGQINATNLKLIMSFIHAADRDPQSLDTLDKELPLLNPIEETIDPKDIDKLLLLLEPYKSIKPKTVTHIFNRHVPNYFNYPPLSTDLSINKMWIPKTINDAKWSNQQNKKFQIPVNKPLWWSYLWKRYGYNPNSTQAMNFLSMILQIAKNINSEYVTNLLNKYGLMELTYMIQNPKPPVHYVKFRIPMIKFLTNIKSLVLENPHLSNDPMKLLQKLIIKENMSEVSPIWNDFGKEDILKLTAEDGNLVEAKLLERKISNLNEQVKLAHSLNAEISPEEILQQNNVNAVEYFTNTASNVGGPANTYPQL